MITSLDDFKSYIKNFGFDALIISTDVRFDGSYTEEQTVSGNAIRVPMGETPMVTLEIKLIPDSSYVGIKSEEERFKDAMSIMENNNGT
jgi:hypothetical protein